MRRIPIIPIIAAALLAWPAAGDTPIGTTLYRVGAGKIEGSLLADTVKSVSVSGSVITVTQRDAQANEVSPPLAIDVRALAGSGGSAAAAEPDDFRAAALARLFALAEEDYETRTQTGSEFVAIVHGTLEAGGFGALEVAGYDAIALDYDDQLSLPASAAGFGSASGANSRRFSLERDGVPAQAVLLGRTAAAPPALLVSFAQPGTHRIRLRDLTRRAAATDATITGDGAAATPLAVANPFTAADEAKLDAIEAGATADQTPAQIRDALAGLSGADRLAATAIRDLPTGAASAVRTDATLSGTGAASSPLSVANPFTAADEAKLDAIEAGATARARTDATITGDGSAGSPLAVANPFTAADEAKLDAIEAGATAGGEANVQADWDVADSASDAFIRNKPPTLTRTTLEEIGYDRTAHRTAVFGAFGGDLWHRPASPDPAEDAYIATTFATVARPASPANLTYAPVNTTAPRYTGVWAVIRIPAARKAELGRWRLHVQNDTVTIDATGATWTHLEDVGGEAYYSAAVADKPAGDDLYVQRFDPFELDAEAVNVTVSSDATLSGDGSPDAPLGVASVPWGDVTGKPPVQAAAGRVSTVPGNPSTGQQIFMLANATVAGYAFGKTEAAAGGVVSIGAGDFKDGATGAAVGAAFTGKVTSIASFPSPWTARPQVAGRTVLALAGATRGAWKARICPSVAPCTEWTLTALANPLDAIYLLPTGFTALTAGQEVFVRLTQDGAPLLSPISFSEGKEYTYSGERWLPPVEPYAWALEGNADALPVAKLRRWNGTRAAYDALAKDATTVYLVID